MSFKFIDKKNDLDFVLQLNHKQLLKKITKILSGEKQRIS